LSPANSIWIWGAGKKPVLPLFRELYGLEGVVVAAVDLVRGIGRCAGLEAPVVPGATGNIHTNFRGKARAALDALSAGYDFVYLHIEAPDEAGHQGNLELKVRAIEAIDREVLSEILKGLEAYPDYRLLLLPDHTTPVSTRTHGTDPVPFVIAAKEPLNGGAGTFDEPAAAGTGLRIEPGFELLPRYFLRPGLRNGPS
jgi:2,3-bisphosphoglycerate-independent phosphoglycerate mutase